jgi:rhombotail lipoprotein
MKSFCRLFAAALPALALLAGCGAAPHPMAPEAPAMRAEEPRPVLARSLYTKDSSGALSENDLQHVLESPIDLQFPARIGVVPLAQAFDPESDVSISIRSVASRDFARALSGNPHFSHVSDISTELPNSGGIEGLRVIAARYRLRYLLLYSERFEDVSHVNGWAVLYPTIIGMFIAPGVTVKSHGLAQADLLDVRTGTILFSVVEPMQVEDRTQMIGAERSHRELELEAAAKAAKMLAKRVTAQTNELIAFAESAGRGEERARTRILPAPVVAASGSGGPLSAVAQP